MSWYELLVKSQIAVAVDLLYSVREVFYSANKVKDTLHQAQCTHIDTMIQYSCTNDNEGYRRTTVLISETMKLRLASEASRKFWVLH